MVTAVVSRLTAAAATTPTNPTLVQVERGLRIVAFVFAGYFALLLVGLAVLIAFCAVIFVVMRLNGPDSPFTRRLAARLVARSAPGSTHRADERGDPAAIVAGLDTIRAEDPLFDEQVVIEAARRALFFLFVAGLDGNDRRLRQVSTERFWHTPAGAEVEERVKQQMAIVDSMRRLGNSQEAAMLKGLRPMVLDYDAHEAELWAVQAGVDDVDRITVRLAYRGEAALAGPGAAQRAHAMTGRIDLSANRQRRAEGASGATAMPPVDSARVATQGWYDFELSRGADVRSSPEDGTAGRSCPNCGAPYRSDLDSACRNCRAGRTAPDGGWKLDRSWLVVDTEARAGEGVNRDRHDRAWALRGAGKIALRVGGAILD